MLILMIHGLGGLAASYFPMKIYLEKYFGNYLEKYLNEKLDIQTFDYPSRSIDFMDVISQIEKHLDNYSWKNNNEYAILIGHSLGGIICTHINQVRVKGVITVSSPHTGCDLVETVKKYAPDAVSNFAFGKMSDILTAPANTSSVSKIICITTSLTPFLKFDGRVHTKEMIHPQAYKTMHLEYSDHTLQLLDIRLFKLINECIMDLSMEKYK